MNTNTMTPTPTVAIPRPVQPPKNLPRRIYQTGKEIAGFAYATLLSCGPSQIFGVIRGAIDGIRYTSCHLRDRKWSRISKQIKTDAGWNDFNKSKTIRRIAKKLGIEPTEVDNATVERYITAKQTKLQHKIGVLSRQLRADSYALIPFAGAHISWRVATSYEGKKFSAIFSRSTAQLCEPFQKICSKLFFLGRTSDGKTPRPIAAQFFGYQKREIPVITSTRNRSINAYYKAADKQDDQTPTIVIFHPSVGSAKSMIETNAPDWYREKGFNVLCVTIGGYPGSGGITTSEASAYQDVEAIKQYLHSQGHTRVAYHGWSMGSGFAMHAAAEESPDGMETLFVVADRPYTSVEGVGGNIGGGLGKGIMMAALPKDRPVELPGGKWIKTDGIDNVKKVKTLKKKNIPLFCIEAQKDFLMGRAKSHGRYQENFAKDLLHLRYEDNEVEKLFCSVSGGHFEPLGWHDFNAIMGKIKA